MGSEMCIRDRFCRVLDSYLVCRLVDVLREVGVVSLLESGVSVSEVARRLGLDRDLLYRVVEALEVAGVFRWVGGRLVVRGVEPPSSGDLREFSPHFALAVDFLVRRLVDRLRSSEDRVSALLDRSFYLMVFNVLHACPAMFYTRESLLSYLGFKPRDGVAVVEFVGVPYGDATVAVLRMLRGAGVGRFRYVAVLPSEKLCGEWWGVVERWCGEFGVPESYLSSIEYEVCGFGELSDFVHARDWCGRFDCVVSSSFLHWLPHDVRLNFIGCVFKLLCSGGRWFNLCSLYSRGRVTVLELLLELFTEFCGCVSEYEFRGVGEVFRVERKVLCNLMSHSSLSFCAGKRGGGVGVSGEVLFLGKMYHYSFGTSV